MNIIALFSFVALVFSFASPTYANTPPPQHPFTFHLSEAQDYTMPSVSYSSLSTEAGGVEVYDRLATLGAVAVGGIPGYDKARREVK